ncbi:DUF1641 domain-containing protein [Paenibacillus beijingensis]|uniref:DUF1641 domain-containing protein n=1 Tax=Paenibacillus beijingensis TaxID=1126833 RepID=A0A0D5NHC1_9BACL|nr:DUF1641 domain-containing protein [Paenibacillus beijingensis]AJY74651.1 hypothetical protein VN24_08765 [Paenibacillus beijingensis]
MSNNQQTATSVATETPAVQKDILDQLMKPEVQQSLTVLVDNLPKLAEMVTLLTNSYDVAKSLATDKVLINDFAGGIGEVVKPLVEKTKGVAQAAIEAGDKAQTETNTIGLFGLLKLLKDPNVQKSLRFTQAFLEALGEKQNK